MDIQNIAHYRVVRRLGSGGMGEVYLAEDTELERSVAIKVMSAELAKDPNQRKRFRAEAKAASGLSHPNICIIHEVGETEDGRPFLSMEYVQGTTLDAILRQRKPTPEEVVKIGMEVAEALDAAHSVRIIHRDVKAANIMLDRRGVAKVLDFGLAKRFNEDELAASTTSVPQTKTGMLIGTPHYMSPEQALGRDLDPKSDIFSLGIVLYELVAGQRPFLGATVGEVINSIINHRQPPVELPGIEWGADLDRVIAKCLEKDPAHRYSSAKALAADLGDIKSQINRAPSPKKSSEARPPLPGLPATTKRRSVPTWVFASASLIVATGVIVALILTLRSTKNSDSGLNAAKLLPDQAQNSVAVLPFDNFSSESDTEYLSDGLTEEITTALSRLPGLKVVARNSAFAFKGKKEDARKIGMVLQVTKLLEGSIQKSGKRIHVNAQLINTSDGFRLWSETYDRSIDDVLQVQEEIARRIADRLQVSTRASLQSHKSVNPEAYKLYLQARAAWNQRTEPGLQKAIQLFKAALNTQPDYADAYAGLAAAYYVLPEYSSSTTERECQPLARAAANHALELDPTCAEPHAVLAGLQAAYQTRDFKGAEEHFRRAMELDPNYATAHHWFGRYLLTHGENTKALVEFQSAVDLDPLSPAIRTTIPNWYYMTMDFDRAIEESRKVIAAFPEFPPARICLTFSWFMKGDYQKALDEVEATRALLPQDPTFCIELRGYALGRLGKTEQAQLIVSQIEALCANGKPLESAAGFVYLGLRDYDKSLSAFTKAAERDGIPDEFFSDPFWNEVRNLPGFKALAKKAGFNDPKL